MQNEHLFLYTQHPLMFGGTLKGTTRATSVLTAELYSFGPVNRKRFTQDLRVRRRTYPMFKAATQG